VTAALPPPRCRTLRACVRVLASSSARGCVNRKRSEGAAGVQGQKRGVCAAQRAARAKIFCTPALPLLLRLCAPGRTPLALFSQLACC
jgi:hypothetical protein